MSKRHDNRPLIEVGIRSIKLAVIAAIVAALYFGKSILTPLALAVLLSLLLTPPVHFLERFIGRVAAVIVCVVISIALLSSAAYGVSVKAGTLVGHTLPKKKENIRQKLETLKNFAGKRVAQTIDNIVSEISPFFAENRPPDESGLAPAANHALWGKVVEYITSILSSLLAPLETTFIVLIFSIYFLMQPDDLRNRLLRLAGKNKISAASHAFDEVGKKVSRYLMMQLIINIAYGLAIALGMTVLKMEDGFVWGGLVTILRFIPYVGTWVAALPPFLILVASTSGWEPAYLLMLFAAMDLLFAYIIEPQVIGGGVGISPLSLLVAAVFWTSLWGALGLLLSTPLTVCLVVMGKHVSALKFLNILLTDKPVLTATVRFYHRLLSGNRAGALKLLKAESKNKTFCQVCDDTLLPVLAMSEFDLRGGSVTERKAWAARELAVELISEQEANIQQAPEKAGSKAGALDKPVAGVASKTRILCIPAHSDADELAAKWFSGMLRYHGISTTDVPVDRSITDILSLIKERDVSLVCISALPPAASRTAGMLLKNIHARFPKLPVMIGLWTRKSALAALRRKIGAAHDDLCVASFAEGMKHIQDKYPQLLQAEVEETGGFTERPTEIAVARA